MFEPSLVPADNHWALWAVILSIATFGLWAEKTRWGSRLSGAIISILTAFVAANLAIIPSAAPAYDLVWAYFVPLAIPLLLFQADLRRIIKEAGPTLMAFACGSVGTVIGTVIAFRLIPLGEHGWQLAAIFCSTYIGGSMNFAAASEAVQLHSGDLLSAGIAADNLVMTVYFLLLFSMPSIPFFRKYFKNERIEQAVQPTGQAAGKQAGGGNFSLVHFGSALAISATLCAIGFAAQNLLGIPGSAILLITVFVVTMATVYPHKFGAISGSTEIGTFFMQIFFVVIGASAHVMTVLRVGPVLFLFAAVILLVHLAFLLTAGKLLRLDLSEIVIASNANMGGPTTAAAMAVARKWQDLVIPAILCGTLGYAVATFIGVGVGFWLK